MADKSGISWTDATWNPFVGCSITSPGCRLCYAMREAHRLAANPLLLGKYQGLTEIAANGRPVWNGTVRLHAPALEKPIRWTRPRLIFVNSMSDLFHESIAWEDIDKVFAVMLLAPQHVFQILTKRSAIMRAYMNDPDTPRRVQMAAIALAVQYSLDASPAMSVPWPPPNAHMGISAERQTEADERVLNLMKTKAAVRWVSGEPLLGDIDFTRIAESNGVVVNALTACAVRKDSGEIYFDAETLKAAYDSQSGAWGRIDGIVTGGENGDRLDGAVSTPSHPDWHQRIADQCETYSVGFHFKQWGSWLPLRRDQPAPIRKLGGALPMRNLDDTWVAYHVGKKDAGNVLNGKVYQDWPKLPEVPA